MILMQLNNIVKSFAGQMLLQNVQMEVKSNDKIAIVGRNGAGKSTILKMMTGETDYDEGSIFTAKGIEIGYLSQHNGLESDETIWEEMLSVFDNLISEEQQLQEMAKQIEEMSATDQYDERLMLEYSTRQENFSENGGYRFKSDIKGVLKGLGFQESDFDLVISNLSGGQKTRLALGKLLLTKPNLLILDEPTNHLDIATLSWLENYLNNYDGAIVIVSHDRYFLDKIVHIIYEVANQQTIKYHGTYTKFLEIREQNYERDLKNYEKQQKEIHELEDFIAKNIARASTSKRAQSKRKQLEKMNILDKPFKDNASSSFSFHSAKTSGNDVLHVTDFAHYHPGEDDPLFSNVSFHINRGQRVALIGENGIGKTTLLEDVMEPHDNIKLGANVEVGYYAQEQELLQPKNSILEEVWEDFRHIDEQEIRTVLGNFLFTDDDVFKKIQTLSGGEKARVALAKLMLKKANFLILDEPTNHLDVASKEVLEGALLQFKGTILFVSHDRYFINKLADEIIELEKNGLTVYLGNYDYYREKKAEQEAILEMEKQPADNPKAQQATKQQLTYEEQKKQQSEARKKQREIEKLESNIETLEDQLNDIEKTMTEPDVLQDHEQLQELSNEAEDIRAKIDETMETWANLQT